MRNVLKTLSLSVLFTISACVVDDPTEEAKPESTDLDDLPTFEGGGRGFGIEEKESLESENQPSWPSDEEPKGDEDSIERDAFCEDDDDCKSLVCDKPRHICHDYPF
jgi:hypothetical protein